MLHFRKVHIADLKAVPNSIPGRDDPGVGMQIFGTRNVPEEVLEEWRLKSSAPHEIFGASVTATPHSLEPRELPTMMDALPDLPANIMGGMSGLQSSAPSQDQSASLQEQLQAWMSKKEEPEEEQPPPPPDMDGPPPGMESNANGPGGALPAWLADLPQALTGSEHAFAAVSKAAPQQPPMQQNGFSGSRVDPGSSNTIAQMWETATAAVAAAVDAHTAPALQEQAPRSRSRGRRSQSRGRRDNRGQDARRSRSRGGRGGDRRDFRGNERRRSPIRNTPPANLPPTAMELRTIAITAGTVGTRLWLKKEMERFGRVEVCHTGNRSNPEAEPPWVRFEKASSAETCMIAMKAGQVILDGGPILGELKRGGRQQAPPPQIMRRNEQDMEITSRDLARQMQGRGRVDDRRGRDRQDSRSRSRRGRR